MISNNISPRELWLMQHISNQDVDYDSWEQKREMIRNMSQIIQGCLFTVDVFRERYDFASENFTHIFGYNPTWIETIREQGDLLEERIHPDDLDQIRAFQIEHGKFIYSLPPEYRNDYQQIFQYRILNARQQYMNVISRQQVIEKDRNGKAWIIMGIMDISPDQVHTEKVKRTILNRKTGEIIKPGIIPPTNNILTNREKEVLLLIHKGFLSKEIADQLCLSIHTVNNHRKNILAKLNVNNVIEAINKAETLKLLY